ncbi:MAG: transglycosylase SLT domain-containing protein [Paracoccaceae bacterium]
MGGVLSPWPWAVNQAGAGSFFDTKADAMNHVARAMADGKSNIDVGCFQINIRWHGAEFASLSAMFDPTENAIYAARFLLGLYDEFGSWEGAIGAYHSRNSGAATAYLSKVSAVMTAPSGAPTPRASQQAAARDNRYPLLRPGKAGAHGSLVAAASDRAAIPLFR